MDYSADSLQEILALEESTNSSGDSSSSKPIAIDDSDFILVQSRPSQQHGVAFCQKKFQHFADNNQFFDLKITCQNGDSLFCHRLIIASCSPVLESMLIPTERKCELVGQEISLPNVNILDLKTLIRFMYSGKTVVLKNSISRICQLSKTLKIECFPDEASIQEMISNEDRINNNELTTTEDVAEMDTQDNNNDTSTTIPIERVKSNDDSLQNKIILPKPSPLLRSKIIRMHCSSSSVESQNLPSQSSERSFSSDLLMFGTLAIDLGPEAEGKVATEQKEGMKGGLTSTNTSISTRSKRPFVHRDLEQGFSLKEISTRYNISYKTVRRWRIEQRRLTMQKNFVLSKSKGIDEIVKSDEAYRINGCRKRQRQYSWSSDEDSSANPELLKKVCKMLLNTAPTSTETS